MTPDQMKLARDRMKAIPFAPIGLNEMLRHAHSAEYAAFDRCRQRFRCDDSV
jgi:hypothetical protein